LKPKSTSQIRCLALQTNEIPLAPIVVQLDHLRRKLTSFIFGLEVLELCVDLEELGVSIQVMKLNDV
jgi:hypothetical protein